MAHSEKVTEDAVLPSSAIKKLAGVASERIGRCGLNNRNFVLPGGRTCQIQITGQHVGDDMKEDGIQSLTMISLRFDGVDMEAYKRIMVEANGGDEEILKLTILFKKQFGDDQFTLFFDQDGKLQLLRGNEETLVQKQGFRTLSDFLVALEGAQLTDYEKETVRKYADVDDIDNAVRSLREKIGLEI